MVYIPILIFFLMIAVASLIKDELPDCISRIYYILGAWFTAAMILISLFTMPLALEAWDSVFSFVMCGAIAFVGVAPNYLDINEKKVHFTSAAISALCSVIFVGVVNPECLMILSLAFLGFVDNERWLFWCEIPCFLSVFISLILQ